MESGWGSGSVGVQVFDKDVWQLLLTEDYLEEAETLIAAAIGAESNPQVFTVELERSALKLVELRDDAEAIANRLVRLVAAVTALSRSSLEHFARLVEEIRLEDEDAEPDPELIRRSMVYLLNEYASALRELLPPAGE